MKREDCPGWFFTLWLFCLVYFIVSMVSLCHAQTVSSDHVPKVERLQNSIIIPYDVRDTSRDGVKLWEYKELRIPDKGQAFTESNAADTVASQLKRQTAAADAAALLAALSYANIDAHVDTTFANLSAAQKTSLKKLYKAVLYLLKEDQSAD